MPARARGPPGSPPCQGFDGAVVHTSGQVYRAEVNVLDKKTIDRFAGLSDAHKIIAGVWEGPEDEEHRQFILRVLQEACEETLAPYRKGN